MLRITISFGTPLLRRIANQHVIFVVMLYLLLPSFAYPGDPEDALLRLRKVVEMSESIESSHSYSYLIKEEYLIIGEREDDPPEEPSMFTRVGRFVYEHDPLRTRRAELFYQNAPIVNRRFFRYAHDELRDGGKSILVDRREPDVEFQLSVFPTVHFNPIGLVFDSYHSQMNRIYTSALLLQTFKSFSHVLSEKSGTRVTDYWIDPNRHGIYEITYREGNGGLPNRVNYFYSPTPLPLDVKTVEDWRRNTEILIQNEASYVRSGDHFVPEHVEQITYQNRKNMPRDEYVRSYVFVDWRVGTIDRTLLDPTNLAFPSTHKEFLELEKEISSR